MTSQRRSIPVRLICHDDRSNLSQTQENIHRLLKRDRVDILFGPYSSGLTKVAASIAEEEKKILWNHGGSSDVIFQQGFQFLVGVPSPASDYLRELPALLRRYEAGFNRLVVMKRQKGSFAAHVASGVKGTAHKQGLEILPIHLEPGRLNTSQVIQIGINCHWLSGDRNSGSLRTKNRLVLVPRSSESELVCSSITLTPRLLPTLHGASVGDPFVLGKYKVIPALSNEFVPEDRSVQTYFEVYNLDLDQSSLEPSVRIEISLYREGEPVFPLTPIHSEYEFVADRLLVYKTIPFHGLIPGKYTLVFRITDRIKGRQLQPHVDFVMK